MKSHTTSVYLHFSATTQASCYINCPLLATRAILKQITVVVPDTNLPLSKLAILKSNLLQNGGSQVLCGLPVGLNDFQVVSELSVNFIPISTTVAGDYTFTLSETNQKGIQDVANLDLYLMLVIEFVQE